MGMMNPAIHHPSWYHSMNLLSEQERDSAVSGALVMMPQVSQFVSPDFGIACLPERWEIQTPKFATMDRILATASRVFEILDHTPVKSFGFNFHFHREVSIERVGDRLGAAIKQLPLGLQVLGTADGQLVLTSMPQGQKKMITIAQSQLGLNRVFVGLNFHYDIVLTDPSAHFDLSPLLAEHFRPDYTEGERLTQAVIEGLPKIGGAIGSRN
jgi:hypothetical protein